MSVATPGGDLSTTLPSSVWRLPSSCIYVVIAGTSFDLSVNRTVGGLQAEVSSKLLFIGGVVPGQRRFERSPAFSLFISGDAVASFEALVASHSIFFTNNPTVTL